jgi:ABC-2 type transport system ATP-binding protein
MEWRDLVNAIEVHGLTHARPGFAIDGIELELPTGSVLGLVGPNGAGKTTTISAMLGMLEPDAGTIRLLGEPLTRSRSVMQRVGVVLDRPFVSPDWRVDGLGRRIGPFYRRWDEAEFRRLLERFDVPTSARVGTLSRGQSVALSLALALGHRPDLLVLDEPSSGLDPASRSELADVLREFMIDETHSVLLSTHITSDLEGLADHVAVLGRGRVAWSGTMDDLREGFAVVRGFGLPAPDAAAAIVGIRREGERFDGLVRTHDSALFGPDAVLDAAGVDDVILYLAREGHLREALA